MGILLSPTGVTQRRMAQTAEGVLLERYSTAELATPLDHNVSNIYGDPTISSRSYTADEWHKHLEEFVCRDVLHSGVSNTAGS
jgi:hypothetical protein